MRMVTRPHENGRGQGRMIAIGFGPYFQKNPTLIAGSVLACVASASEWPLVGWAWTQRDSGLFPATAVYLRVTNNRSLGMADWAGRPVILALKGRNRTAQGIALGPSRPRKPPALKGRDRVSSRRGAGHRGTSLCGWSGPSEAGCLSCPVPPFQGGGRFRCVAGNPGRCPGLSCFALSGRGLPVDQPSQPCRETCCVQPEGKPQSASCRLSL